jgi:hypothetical protein
LRSPRAGANGYFCRVTTSGSVNYNSATLSYGFAPVICVGKEEISGEDGVSTFNNPGTREINYRSPDGGESIITATVGENVEASFLLNGKVLTYSGPAGTLIIDNLNMEATIDGQNAFGYLDGDIDTFLEIIPGVNKYTSNGATNVTIAYIPLWV